MNNFKKVLASGLVLSTLATTVGTVGCFADEKKLGNKVMVEMIPESSFKDDLNKDVKNENGIYKYQPDNEESLDNKNDVTQEERNSLNNKNNVTPKERNFLDNKTDVVPEGRNSLNNKNNVTPKERNSLDNKTDVVSDSVKKSSKLKKGLIVTGAVAGAAAVAATGYAIYKGYIPTDGVKSAMSTAGKGVVSAGKAAGHGIATAGKAVGNGVSKAGETVGKAGKTAGKGIVSAVKATGHGMAAAGKAVGNGVSKAGKGIANTANKLPSEGKKILGKIFSKNQEAKDIYTLKEDPAPICLPEDKPLTAKIAGGVSKASEKAGKGIVSTANKLPSEGKKILGKMFHKKPEAKDICTLKEDPAPICLPEDKPLTAKIAGGVSKAGETVGKGIVNAVKATGHGIATAGKAVGNGVSKAGETVVNAGKGIVVSAGKTIWSGAKFTGELAKLAWTYRKPIVLGTGTVYVCKKALNIARAIEQKRVKAVTNIKNFAHIVRHPINSAIKYIHVDKKPSIDEATLIEMKKNNQLLNNLLNQKSKNSVVRKKKIQKRIPRRLLGIKRQIF